MPETPYTRQLVFWVAKASHWDDHPDFPVTDWKYEVANDDTRQSYKEWLLSKAEDIREGAVDEPATSTAKHGPECAADCFADSIQRTATSTAKEKSDG